MDLAQRHATAALRSLAKEKRSGETGDEMAVRTKSIISSMKFIISDPFSGLNAVHFWGDCRF